VGKSIEKEGWGMEHLCIDQSSGVPIYVQLKEKIKYAIATGVYPPASRLPTVRSLAVALKINVNTVSKVYSELEREGILATKQGRGTFVGEVTVSEKEVKEQKLRQMAEQVQIIAHELGVTPGDLLEMLKKRLV